MLDKINIKNHDELSSYLMQNYINKKLFFKNSYVSKVPIINIKLSIIKHFTNMNRIAKEDFEEFISVTGLNVLYNYYSLIRDVKKLTLISSDVAINVDEFEMSELEIKKINNVLDLYFKNNEIMYTKKLNLKMFPNMENYTMNKYLLISIIDKYLSDKYEVAITDILNNNCDYVVRRK